MSQVTLFKIEMPIIDKFDNKKKSEGLCTLKACNNYQFRSLPRLSYLPFQIKGTDLIQLHIFLLKSQTRSTYIT